MKTAEREYEALKRAKHENERQDWQWNVESQIEDDGQYDENTEKDTQLESPYASQVEDTTNEDGGTDVDNTFEDPSDTGPLIGLLVPSVAIDAEAERVKRAVNGTKKCSTSCFLFVLN